MPADYTDAPLIEALCEFRFEPARSWDWTISELVYARVRDQMPIRQEQRTIEFGLADGQIVPPSPPGLSRVQFLRQDGSALIQIGTDYLGVNHLRPYPDWNAFSNLIFENLDIYAEIAQPKNLVKIGLRYINKIEVPTTAPGEKLKLSDYLQALPSVPPTLQRNVIQSFIQRVEIGNAEAQGTLVLQSGSLPAEREGCLPFLLDLDFVTTPGEQLPLDQARQWITRAHEEIELAFEACIGDQARLLFGDKHHG